MSALSPADHAPISTRRAPAARARRVLDVLLLAGAVGFVALATIGGGGPSALQPGAAIVASAP